MCWSIVWADSTSGPSVLRTDPPCSHSDVALWCSDCGAARKPVTMLTCSRSGSKRLSSGGSSSFAAGGGVQICGRTPFGTYTAPNRNCGGGSACAAGTIASSNGKPIAVPTAPRNNVRRETCFFVMNMVVCPSVGRARGAAIAIAVVARSSTGCCFI